MICGLLLSALSVVSVSWAQPAPPYELVRDYSGQTFFNGWDFFGFRDNLTWGNVTYVDAPTAASDKLAYVNDAGKVILKVDNTTTVASGDSRNSVRITTHASYGLGSMWIFDVSHLPYGCSVWPAYWSKGPVWPDDGEIDIIEAVNLMQNNEGALHTLEGCTHSATSNPALELGQVSETDCSTPAGCVVTESKPNSYGPTFNAAGGGVWATSFDATGVYIWFWSRPDVPKSITSLTSTSPLGSVSDWGVPSMAWPAINCNIPKYFTDQQIVLDITLCGGWAGIDAVYSSTCGTAGPTGLCYNDSIVGAGSKFDQAYFEINYLRTYTNNASTFSSISAAAAASTTGGNAAASTAIATSSSTHTASKSGAEGPWKVSQGTLLSVGMALITLVAGGQIIL
ncbi:glycoside hydrolase family 16 protein [Jaapia argillacea MUCL 33604]|uniref:Glycoside hydrolase family 16 protein n=1 Tax=Jaapia argillacea MUCL 33604 TaxID=933084 RepID=A0A067Q292_9AGAM|nr:glycoside hydrolase family 16 protein [Jaapia argillacea MUCL 33604]